MRDAKVWLVLMIFPLFGALSGLFGSYFAWKYFALYLPNRQSVDECLPSGGTCSIDGMANLELSGMMMAICFGCVFISIGMCVTCLRDARVQPMLSPRSTPD